jgi:hypothetical protein
MKGNFLKNRGTIEQMVAELESEKKGKLAGPVNITNKPNELVSKEMPETKLDSLKKVVPDQVLKSANAASLLPPSDIYGHKIFRDNSLEIYRTSKDASPPDSYILAAGDKINIVIFGKSQADLQYA